MNRCIEILKKLDKSIYTVFACILVWIAGNVCMESVFMKDKAMGVGMVLLLFAFYFWYVYRPAEDRDKAICNLVLLFGFLVRVIYIWAIPHNASPHDIGNIIDSAEVTPGHLGYIGYIYHYGKIPDMDPREYWSFYNPPLYYILSAIWLRINTVLGIEWNQAVENLQILNLLYTSMAIVAFEKILDELSIKGKAKNLTLCFFGTFPMFNWLSGNMTTDSLMFLFAVLIILYTIRWYKKRDMKTIVILAFCIGFGMITKISLGLFAISVGTVFIWGFVDNIRKDRGAVKRYLLQFLIFLLICAPIGLSWTVRNKVRFGMEADFVQSIGEENSGQYIGNVALVDRIGIPSIPQMSYAKLEYNSELDTNIWMTLARTALYDEGGALSFQSVVAEKVGVFVIFVNIFIGIFMLVSSLIMFVKKSNLWDFVIRLFFALICFTYFISYFKFCFDYPQICSMSFRYIAFLVGIPMIGAGMFLTQKENKYCMKLLTFVCFLGNGLATLLYLKYCMFI